MADYFEQISHQNAVFLPASALLKIGIDKTAPINI